jgi:hypothetical protein
MLSRFRSVSRAAYKLWLQLFAPTRGVLALACYFCDVLCIGAGRTAISIPFFRYTVARGMGTFSYRGHGISFFSNVLVSLKKRAVREGLGLSHRMAWELVPKTFLLAHSNSIAPKQAAICAILLIRFGYWNVISDNLASAIVSGYHDCAVLQGVSVESRHRPVA